MFPKSSLTWASSGYLSLIQITLNNLQRLLKRISQTTTGKFGCIDYVVYQLLLRSSNYKDLEDLKSVVYLCVRNLQLSLDFLFHSGQILVLDADLQNLGQLDFFHV